MPHERWRDRVYDIPTAIEKIQRYTAGSSYEAFANAETVDAVVRNLTIIGEAAQHIPTDIQARIAAIPWTDMRGMRHRIVHDYLAVDSLLTRRLSGGRLPRIFPRLFTFCKVCFPRNGSGGAHPLRAPQARTFPRLRIFLERGAP